MLQSFAFYTGYHSEAWRLEPLEYHSILSDLYTAKVVAHSALPHECIAEVMTLARSKGIPASADGIYFITHAKSLLS